MEDRGAWSMEDRGAWRATVHGAAKSRTRLSDYHTHQGVNDPGKDFLFKI